MKTLLSHTRYFLAVLVLCLAGAGCQHVPEAYEPAAEGPRPETSEILRDLAANHAGIETLRLDGRVSFSGPGFEGTPVLEGRLYHKRPDAFYLEGRKVTSLMVWMAAQGEESLLVLHHKKRFYHTEDADDTGAPFSAAALMREVLFAEAWAEIDPQDVQVEEFHAEEATAVLDIHPGPGRPHRRVVTVQGRPWVITSSRLYDGDGMPLAESIWEDHVVVAGVRLPKRIETTFPKENIGVRMILKSFTVNEEIDTSLFKIDAHLKELEYEGFEAATLRRGEFTELSQ